MSVAEFLNRFQRGFVESAVFLQLSGTINLDSGGGLLHVIVIFRDHRAITNVAHKVKWCLVVWS